MARSPLRRGSSTVSHRLRKDTALTWVHLGDQRLRALIFLDISSLLTAKHRRFRHLWFLELRGLALAAVLHCSTKPVIPPLPSKLTSAVVKPRRKYGSCRQPGHNPAVLLLVSAVDWARFCLGNAVKAVFTVLAPGAFLPPFASFRWKLEAAHCKTS